MLDADNLLRPIAIGRLMDALDGEPDASFAYGILEQFGADGALGLVSRRAGTLSDSGAATTSMHSP